MRVGDLFQRFPDALGGSRLRGSVLRHCGLRMAALVSTRSPSEGETSKGEDAREVVREVVRVQSVTGVMRINFSIVALGIPAAEQL